MGWNFLCARAEVVPLDVSPSSCLRSQDASAEERILSTPQPMCEGLVARVYVARAPRPRSDQDSKYRNHSKACIPFRGFPQGIKLPIPESKHNQSSMLIRADESAGERAPAT